MKAIIFGSTGGTGCQLVTQMLKQGHEVTAFARNPDKITQIHKNLTIVKGNILDISAVEQAVQEHDVVLCTLGMPNIMDKSGLRAKGTKNIIQVMEKMNIKRLVCQSSLGTGDSHRLLPWHYKYLISPLFMKQLYSDHLIQESHIKASSLEWVIVRPGVLSDGKQTGVYQYGASTDNKAIKAKISRADTANFMLKQLDSSDFLYKTPYISY